jgi:anti-sigma regulatory factor (Ser/Thr protein kinase)
MPGMGRSVSMAAEQFETDLAHDPSRLAHLRSAMIAWLESGAIEGEVRDAVVLSTHEAVAHAIEHGARDGPIRVVGEVGTDAVTVTVTSARGWKAPAPSEYPGTGLVLTRALMSEVASETTSHVSVVRMKRAL